VSLRFALIAGRSGTPLELVADKTQGGGALGAIGSHVIDAFAGFWTPKFLKSLRSRLRTGVGEKMKAARFAK